MPDKTMLERLRSRLVRLEQEKGITRDRMTADAARLSHIEDDMH